MPPDTFPRQSLPCRGVRLCQPLAPVGILQDRLVGLREEVPVHIVAGEIAHDWRLPSTLAALQPKSPGVSPVASTEFLAERGRIWERPQVGKGDEHPRQDTRFKRV